MPAEEFEHRALHRRITKSRAQFIRRQAGERQEPFGARRIAEHPAERLQRSCGWIVRGGGFTGDCQGLPR